MAAIRDTQDVLIIEETDASGKVRATQDVIILETVPTGFGHVRDTQSVLLIELLNLRDTDIRKNGKVVGVSNRPLPLWLQRS
jgi:hypothetical protein